MRFLFRGFCSINTESVIEMKLKFLEQYKHLGKEIYILFCGRLGTSIGSLIWPLLTLILEN